MSMGALVLFGLLLGVFIGMNSPLIGTFTTFITSKIGKKSSSNSIAITGLLTLLYLVMILIIVSFVIATLVETISIEYQQALLVAVPVVAIMIAVSLIRRYFWHEPLVKLEHPRQTALWFSTKSSALLQPLFVALTLLYVVLPIYSVVAVLFSLISLLLNELPLFWVLSFAIGFIAPLYAILALLATKTKASKILLWKDKTKATMYLYCGFALLLLAWVVLYVTIQQGGL
jgi:hypothetical protein